MANFLLLLAVVCGGASFAFYTANSAAGDVPNGASTVCFAAPMLCHYPLYMAYAGAGLAVLAFLIKFVSAVRG